MSKKMWLLFFIIILLISTIATASYIEETHGLGFNLVNINANFEGIEFNISTNMTIMNITTNHTNATTCMLLKKVTGTPFMQSLKNGSMYNNRYCSFNFSINRTYNNSNYTILIGHNTSKTVWTYYNRTYIGGAGVPIISGNITWLKCAYAHDTNYSRTCGGDLANIIDITYSTGEELPPSISSLNISVGSILNNTQYNRQNININLTANATYIFNCSLYINRTLNQTINNYPAGSSINVVFNNTFMNGAYNYTINCTNNETNQSTSENLFYVDITVPMIDGTNFTNGSFYFRKNLSAQFNFSDNEMLHSYNITIEGYQISANNNIQSNYYSANFTYDISNLNLSSGTHIMQVEFADGHTANELGGDYVWTTGIFGDYLRYDFYDKGYIKTQLETPSVFDDWTTKKEKDRYTQILKPANPSDTIVLIEESDMPIYIKNTPGLYKGEWIVTGNHWKDYVLENEPNQKVSIKRIDDYHVKVTISGIGNNKDTLIFKSIGDLNVVTKTYSLLTTNITISYSSAVSELQEQIITARIEKPAGITGSNITLFYNYSQYEFPRTPFASYDWYTNTSVTPELFSNITIVEIAFQYNVTSTAGSETGNITVNQTIYKVGIDNCTIYKIKAVNFTFRRDDTDNIVVGNMKGYFQVWVDQIHEFTRFNLTWEDRETVGICISPNTSSYHAYAQFEYINSTFGTKTYYFTNTTLDNRTDNITLWFTPNSTEVVFTVTDQDDNEMSEVYIYVLKYDFGTNTYTTSEIIKTDKDGEAIGDIKLTTQWYKFMLVYDGVTVLETDPIKIITTTKSFRVNLLDDYFVNFNEMKGIITSISYTNATKNFVYTWLNPTGNSVTACLKVIERGALGDRMINESCSTAASGSILVHIGTATEGKTFIGTGTVSASPEFFTDMWVVSYDEGYKKWGEEGIFVTYLLKLVLAFSAVWNPAVAILGVFIVDVIMVLAKVYHMGWGTISIYLLLVILSLYKIGLRRT